MKCLKRVAVYIAFWLVLLVSLIAAADVFLLISVARAAGALLLAISIVRMGRAIWSGYSRGWRELSRVS
jgi:hypothetical protein